MTDALTLPLEVTYFSGPGAQTADRQTTTLRDLAKLISATSAPTKPELPWLKLARFGDQRTKHGALRHNANMVDVWGVELDYDDKKVTPGEAARRLRLAGIAALVYTSPSHTLEAPKWRVLAPLSQRHPPNARYTLAGRLNTAIGTIAATESFTDSQAFYFGETPAGDDHHTILIPGRPLDECTLTPSYPARKAAEPILLPPRVLDQTTEAYALEVLSRACAEFSAPGAAERRHHVMLSVTLTVAPFVLAGFLDPETVENEIEATLGRPANGGEIAGALQGALRMSQPYFLDTGGAEFAEDPLPDLPTLAQRHMFPRAFTLRDPVSIEPREWVYGGHYIRKFLSATVAPGGLGKSSLAIVEALDMATGRGLLTGKPTGRRFRVVYWNGEDPLEETERRVLAACKHYRITAAELGDRLIISSGRDLPIRIATDTRDGFSVAEPLVDDLIRELKADAVDVLMLDPFVKTHSVSENDNSKIDAVASQFARVADAANVAVELIHHVRKAAAPGQDRTAEDARGAAALISAARSVRVLNVMLQPEAEQLGIPDETRRRCFRVDDGKVNLVPPRGSGEHAVWRYLESVSLGNARPDRGLSADNIGVVVPWVKPAVGDSVQPEHLDEIGRRLAAGEPNRREPRSPDWAGVTVAAALGIDMNGPGDRKRVGRIIDALLDRGHLGLATALDEKRRPRTVIAMSAPTRSDTCQSEPERVGADAPPTRAPTVEHGVWGWDGAGSKPCSDGADTLLEGLVE